MSKNRLKTLSIVLGISFLLSAAAGYASYSPLAPWTGGNDGSWGWGGDNIKLPLAIYNSTASNLVLKLGSNSCTDNTATRFSTSPPPGGTGTTSIPPGQYWSAYLGFNSGDGCSLMTSTAYMYLNMYVQSSNGLQYIGWLKAEITSALAAAANNTGGISITSGNMKNGYTVYNQSYNSNNPGYAVAQIDPPPVN